MESITSELAPASVARGWVSNLPPSYFSLVMATGIVSIASESLGLHWIAMSLLFVNLLAFCVLWVMTALRMAAFPQQMIADLRAHARGPGYFTIVAGTCVLGAQVFLLTNQAGLAAGLWVLAIILWLLLTYAFFTAAIGQAEKPPLTAGLSGIWLIASVATQSIAVLGTLVAHRFADQHQTILFLCLIFYFIGCMLYIKIITLIFWRLAFMPVEPGDITPPYWINMGATAIATQAGASLILHAGESPLLGSLLPFVKGFTLFFWAAGTWWIPLLLCLAVWTYWLRRVPIVYSPLFWGAVFPLGMYTASTYQLALALEMDALLSVPAVTIYLALLAWGLTFFGLLRRLHRGLDTMARLLIAGHRD